MALWCLMEKITKIAFYVLTIIANIHTVKMQPL